MNKEEENMQPLSKEQETACEQEKENMEARKRMQPLSKEQETACEQEKENMKA